MCVCFMLVLYIGFSCVGFIGVFHMGVFHVCEFQVAVCFMYVLNVRVSFACFKCVTCVCFMGMFHVCVPCLYLFHWCVSCVCFMCVFHACGSHCVVHVCV